MSTPSELQLDARRHGDGLVVAVAGEIDIATADAVAGALRADPGHETAQVVLDLREVTFLDTSGLRLVTEEIHRARASGHTFRVVRGPERVQRIFEIAGLAGADLWCDTPEEGLGRGSAGSAP